MNTSQSSSRSFALKPTFLGRARRAARAAAIVVAIATGLTAPLSAAPDAKAKEAELLRVIQTMSEQLRARLDDLPVLLAPEQTLGDIREVTLTLNRDSVVVEGQRFDGIVITAPATGKPWFGWAFAAPANVSRWYVLREAGDMQGFRDFLRRPRTELSGAESLEPKERPQVTLQKLEAPRLTPGARYVLWFAFSDEAPTEITFRAGFFPGAAPANTALPALLFPPKP